MRFQNSDSRLQIADWLVLGALAAFFAIGWLLIGAGSNVTLIDDWVYAWSVEHLLDTRQLQVLPFSAVYPLAQIASGAIDLPVDPGTTESGGVMRGVNPYEGRLFGMSDFGLGVRDGGWDVR